jgi:hypothetical protein
MPDHCRRKQKHKRPHRNGEAFCLCQLFGLSCWLAHGLSGHPIHARAYAYLTRAI